MPWILDNPVAMFIALFALYSPLASVSAYFPVVSQLDKRDQRKLAFGLFTYVTAFTLIAIWIGEPLLLLLGITPAALTVTGGIALMFVGVPLMRGKRTEPQADTPVAGAGTKLSWRSVVFMPVTFPLSVGGTSFAILVSFRARSEGWAEVIALSVAGVVFAAVTATTVFASGRLERRVTAKTRDLLESIAGILLTAIAVSLLFSGGARLVKSATESAAEDPDAPPLIGQPSLGDDD